MQLICFVVRLAMEVTAKINQRTIVVPSKIEQSVVFLEC